MTGAALTSVTVTEKLDCTTPPTPSSTVTVIGKVPGPWASLGVQVNNPEAESIFAPVGAPAFNR